MYICIYIYIYIYICNHANNVPSRLSPQVVIGDSRHTESSNLTEARWA